MSNQLVATAEAWDFVRYGNGAKPEANTADGLHMERPSLFSDKVICYRYTADYRRIVISPIPDRNDWVTSWTCEA